MNTITFTKNIPVRADYDGKHTVQTAESRRKNGTPQGRFQGKQP